MSLEVKQMSVVQVLGSLKCGEWQIPQFQRDYVWTPDQVKNFLVSFIKSYPTGLVTVWAQPQGRPHVKGEPVNLKGEAFREFQDDPQVISLVLDGKQRLTTMAMVFGGLQSKSGQYSGLWFLDLDAFAGGDEAKMIVYKKQKEIEAENLNSVAACIQKGLIPFKDFSRLNSDYIPQIHNPAIYPVGGYPEELDRNRRSQHLAVLQNTFQLFQIAVAVIPSSVGIGAVCDIFDVLNTTGTKVSTFDLIHNLLFQESKGIFLLRDKFDRYEESVNFSRLCDEDRQAFLCQMVTGCFLLDERAKNQNEPILSIKSEDLMNTPLAFYSEFDRNLEKIDSYTSTLFSDVFKGDFLLREIPYPAQVVIYFSLRWHLEFRLGANGYSAEELNKVFRAFFWRNTLTNRYDQGFLTQFGSDLHKLNLILLDSVKLRGPDWSSAVNRELDKLFGPQFQKKHVEDLKSLVKEGAVKGALGQGIRLLLNSSVKKDLVSNETLNRFTDEKNSKVQLHHIFPKDWCKNNRGTIQALGAESAENCFANLIPLSATSNNAWKAQSPATAIGQYQIDFNNRLEAFNSGFINAECFNFLINDRLEDFWNSRARLLAEALYNAQIVS
jgi:hypothetical protein